ncbi:Maff2 family mobile element protein [Butyrivibrio sp.]
MIPPTSYTIKISIKLGITQLMAGGGIVIIAQTVIPQLTSLFS